MKRIELHQLAHAFALPTVVFLMHQVLARTTNYYGKYPWVDMPMHFMGGVAVTYGFHVLFGEQPFAKGGSKLYYLLSLFALGVMMAVFWEFGEFMQDYLRGSNSQVGLGNTMRDLLLGGLGAATFALALAFKGEPVKAR